MGLLITAPLQSWNPASSNIKEVCAKAVKYCEEEGVDISHLAIKYSTGLKKCAIYNVKPIMHSESELGNCFDHILYQN